MSKTDLQYMLQKFDKELPHFPDGRIDYSDADTALALGIIVLSEGKLLLVKRSDEVSFYPGKWNWPSGFIDEPKPLRQLAEQELHEETGITHEQIADIAYASPITLNDPDLGKTWVIYPVLVYVTNVPQPVLNWEAEDFAWVEPHDINTYDTIPGVADNIRAVLKEHGI